MPGGCLLFQLGASCEPTAGKLSISIPYWIMARERDQLLKIEGT